MLHKKRRSTPVASQRLHLLPETTSHPRNRLLRKCILPKRTHQRQCRPRTRSHGLARLRRSRHPHRTLFMKKKARQSSTTHALAGPSARKLSLRRHHKQSLQVLLRYPHCPHRHVIVQPRANRTRARGALPATEPGRPSMVLIGQRFKGCLPSHLLVPPFFTHPEALSLAFLPPPEIAVRRRIRENRRRIAPAISMQQ